MKSTEYLKKINAMTTEELSKELVDAKKELFNLKFQNATNQLDNTGRIKEARKNIARIMTIIEQRKAAAE
ncbi:MAG: 50S ribosomal protein L29 [Lachnospiraceae bacterium]|nr:50S ribosomal protein L29 [Lachnospiraceae bacterium]